MGRHHCEPASAHDRLAQIHLLTLARCGRSLPGGEGIAGDRTAECEDTPGGRLSGSSCSLLPLESAAWARSGQPEANACSYTRLHVEPSIAIQSAPGARFETSCFLQAFIRH